MQVKVNEMNENKYRNGIKYKKWIKMKAGYGNECRVSGMKLNAVLMEMKV